eukprot:TRINITY_DN106771_c0_g1_i1.p3 TRINITY_DN106771_c0_g1~~TRINITY_DN106771_c0_g1_i1.p3  ORF type:complete len:125 (+),score=10.70 TRINITY_DN106771_c0_g1_i1:124-498(+)
MRPIMSDRGIAKADTTYVPMSPIQRLPRHRLNLPYARVLKEHLSPIAAPLHRAALKNPHIFGPFRLKKGTSGGQGYFFWCIFAVTMFFAAKMHQKKKKKLFFTYKKLFIPLAASIFIIIGAWQN